jgi:hypothetical protein
MIFGRGHDDFLNLVIVTRDLNRDHFADVYPYWLSLTDHDGHTGNTELSFKISVKTSELKMPVLCRSVTLL